MSKYLHPLVLAAGCLLTAFGWQLTFYADVQAIEYNLGRALYLTGDMPKSAAAFEKSIHAGERSNGSLVHDWLYPPPLRLYTSLSRHYRANIFATMQQPEHALEELVAGLRGNGAEQDLDLIDRADFQAWFTDHLEQSIDGELLMIKHPQMAQAMGKGDPSKNKKPGGDQDGMGRDPNDPRNGQKPGLPTSIDDI